MSRRVLAHSWLYLGILALFLSGFLSILITGAKMPFVKPLLGDLLWIRWFLVIHVNLATLVWFTAIPVGLSHLAHSDDRNIEDTGEVIFSFAGLWISILGVLLMMSALPGENAIPLLSNYIPVVTHKAHDMGLVAYFMGVLINYFMPSMSLPRLKYKSEWSGVRFGLWAGAFYFVLSSMTLLAAYMMIDKSQFFTPHSYYETGMWGGGHLLQHSSSVFLVVCWVLLLQKIKGLEGFWTREKLFPVFAGLSASAFVVPILLLDVPTSAFYRNGFTQLMMWGIAPFLGYFIFRTLKCIKWSELFKEKDISGVALIGSFVLVVLGCVFGALIRGPDLRVPGHYHATIGAITVAFFVVTFQALYNKSSKYLTRGVWLYIIGQVMFASGMFTAGYYGVGRKTYGAEHSIDQIGQYIGFGMLGIGGLIALAGGISFGLAVWKEVMVTRRFSMPAKSAVKRPV